MAIEDHVSSLSVTPRSLTEVTGTRSRPRKGTVMLLGNLVIRCLTPNRTNLVFSGLIKRWSRIRDLKNGGYNVDENNF